MNKNNRDKEAKERIKNNKNQRKTRRFVRIKEGNKKYKAKQEIESYSYSFNRKYIFKVL